MTTLTPEQRKLVEKAGTQPVRLEDPETRQAYVLLRADVYDRLREAIDVEDIDPSFFEIDDFEPAGEDTR
jgi:hypothetical protein